MSAAWGTLPVPPEPDSGIAALEREQMMKARPMEVEGPPLHQPCSTPVLPSNEYVMLYVFDHSDNYCLLNVKA